jgi:hypothetical protein
MPDLDLRIRVRRGYTAQPLWAGISTVYPISPTSTVRMFS